MPGIDRATFRPIFKRTAAVVAALALILSSLEAERAAGQPAPRSASKEDSDFFEKHIRPVLVERCYECHSTQARRVRGGLLLDSRESLARGGNNGPIVVPGDVEKSRLIQAIRWTDSDLVMPPKARLSAQQIERFEEWVRKGAPDPRTGAPTATSKKGLDLEKGRTWWAFRPVRPLDAPPVETSNWARTKIDRFVLRKLEAAQLVPSSAADPRTLIERVYLDLIGLRPTYEEAEAFARQPSDEAYAKIVDRLLASPHHGERWGRYWLDVARYGEDNPTSEATNRPYPYAWRYRDWVIDAVNRDVPYDRFVTLQLAADLIPGTPRHELVATGFLGAGPIYHKDGRLSKEVIETLYMDDWDERVDVVSRGILGLTVACARCHDHKFDPISSRDYYALAGVFASTVAARRPMADADPAAESRFMLTAQRVFYLSYLANLLRDEPGSRPADARKKVERFVQELDVIAADVADLHDSNPTLHTYLARLDRRPSPYDARPDAARSAKPKKETPDTREPFFHSVMDAGLWVDGTDPDVTTLGIKPGVARDLHVLAGGNVAKPGEVVPRGFPTVLAKGDPTFHQGSGRRELAERIFSDAAPLAARVMVNRVWGWHFGKPLVETPSDFGAQGEPPSHAELLDDLAARFIANGWSLKWLHREIVLSAAYRQASRPRPDGIKADPANRLLWRMNPRRLDIESYRDCLMQASGQLDSRLAGPSADLDQPGNRRRTVYARISRGRVHNLLQLYGFPEATMHSPGRESTTTALQQLFVLNSPFLHEQAVALAESVAKESDSNTGIRELYRRVLARDPTATELTLANDFLAAGTLVDLAHAILSTNEVIYWP
jgi:hypothetical protein